MLFLNFKIFSNETKSNLEENKIYNLKDIDYSNKKINNYKESNINITFSHYPFNFYLQRKDDGAVLFNSDCALLHKMNYIFIKIIFKYVQKLMKILIFLA